MTSALAFSWGLTPTLVAFFGDLHLFHFLLDLEGDVNFARLACGYLDVRLLKRRKPFGARLDRIASGSQALDFVRSIGVNHTQFGLPRGRHRGDPGSRDRGTRGVCNLASHRAGGGLCQQKSWGKQREEQQACERYSNSNNREFHPIS